MAEKKIPDIDLVSVLTPTMPSRARYWPSLVDSLYWQTYRERPIEWLVYCDNASDSDAAFWEAAGKRLMEKCIILKFRSCEPMDIGAKRNAMMDAAEGEIIIWQDDDDVMLPKRVAVQTRGILQEKAEAHSFQRVLVYNETTDEWGLVWDPGTHADLARALHRT